MSAVTLPRRGVAVDRRTGLRVWSPHGSRASRETLRETLAAAEIRVMPAAEAERRGLREKIDRFQRWGRALPKRREGTKR